MKIGPKVNEEDGYRNLDALVTDAVDSLIEPQFAEDTNIVVIVGRKLLSDKYFRKSTRKTCPASNWRCRPSSVKSGSAIIRRCACPSSG